MKRRGFLGAVAGLAAVPTLKKSSGKKLFEPVKLGTQIKRDGKILMLVRNTNPEDILVGDVVMWQLPPDSFGVSKAFSGATLSMFAGVAEQAIPPNGAGLIRIYG